MNVENVKKVIAALRSGEYEQGRTALERQPSSGESPKLCCLGVTCREAMRNGVEVRVSKRPGLILTKFDGNDVSLPPAVAQWIGMDTNPLLVIPPSVAENADCFPNVLASAATLNDVYKFSFNEIADCFEATIAKEKNNER